MQFGRTLIDSFTDDLHENEFVVETRFDNPNMAYWFG